MSAAQSRSYGIAPPGFRLPDATHVGAVHLQVSDLQRSLVYYEQVLGLRTYAATAAGATLGPHGTERPLVSLQTRSGVVPARRGALGLYHYAILLPDRTSLGSFAAHLSARRVPVGMADHLVSEALYLWDPDGLGIEVYADRPRRGWRQQGNELVMATAPLDLPGLITAADERTWQGMPAGTTIGHVHLHVGRLDEAEAFYHAALGFDKTVWSYPGALFLSAGGYHHHLGTNVWAHGPSARDDEARLREWELIVPRAEDASAAAQSLRAAGHLADDTATGCTAADPWGTQVRVVAGAEL